MVFPVMYNLIIVVCRFGRGTKRGGLKLYLRVKPRRRAGQEDRA